MDYMRVLFGTDGVRGVANQELTVHLALRLARAAATVLRRQGDGRPRVVIGRDTRVSGDMIEAAMIAGFCSAGADVLSAGVIPTAGIAYLARELDVDMGAVISASHNPFEFNGIKFFSHQGFKLPDDVELAIEAKVESTEHLDHPLGADLGRRLPDPGLIRQYIDELRRLAPPSLAGLKLVIDCANGAASAIAPALFRELGAEVITIHDTPDGMNINDGCGATHPEVVGRAVVEHGADAGLSFDGDSDRLMMTDERGRVLDGDHMLAIAARAMLDAGTYRGGDVVGTVMSNLGLERTLAGMGLRLARANVGDRYVLEMMQELDVPLGGEQSGHLIFLNHSTTGDGLITALMMLGILRNSGERLSTLADIMPTFPQKLINIPIAAGARWNENATILRAIADAETDLGADGRVLVRASGTEPKIRVMVEALRTEQVARWTERIAGVIVAELGG